MNLLDAVFGAEPTTQEGRIGSELASAMFNYRMRDRLTDPLFRAMVPDEDRDLALEDRRLGIQLKRRALGLPMDTDDLEDANNGDRSFTTQMRDLAGMRTLQSIPSPGLLQGAESAASHVRLPWEASNMARGAIGALSAIGGKYVSPIRRFFG